MVLALRDHFNPREYVVLPQVRNRAGFDATRTADALVMSTWPSRGLSLYGIEIKVSRGDWLREQKKPDKSDEVAAYCDHWVLAVGDDSIVKDGEVPTAWGLLVPGKKPGTLKMKQPPQKLDAKPMSRSFLAVILRKTLDVVVPLSTVDAEIERRVTERVAAMEANITARITKQFDPQRLMEHNAKLEAGVDAFTKITGVWLSDYDPDRLKRLAKALKLLEWNGLDSWLKRADDQAAGIRHNVAELLKALPDFARNEDAA